MTLVSMKRVDGLLDAVRQNLPRRVTSSGEFEDWNVVGPALIAIAADLFEAIMGATPPRGRVRAEVLARTLTDYAIAFAWLAAADDETDRASRIRSLVRDEYLEREKAENKLGGSDREPRRV
jgi:hypothetical protein